MIEEQYNKVLKYFKMISQIPRNSTEEDKIAEFLCDFAKKRNLFYKKDKNNNVLIKKEASFGYENKKTILFQAHTDMVCQKTVDSKHNFKTDPIEIIQDNQTLRAKDTTLGADDGIGVAFLMLLLDDDNIKHPNIECLFTTEEEIGMNGAREFDYKDIKANYLINLDGEEENTAIVGCAGGITVKYNKRSKTHTVNNNIYELSITNLYGGHSGVDIDKGRTNSNLLASKLLTKLSKVEIISWNGGSKDNAIANNTTVIFTTTSKEVNSIIKENVSSYKFSKEDSNVLVSCNKLDSKEYKAINYSETKNILELIIHLKQNVIEFSKDIENLVETSGNIGIVKIDDGFCSVTESLRSSDDKKRELYKNENNILAQKLGFSIEETKEYPGWKYNPNSKLKDVYKKAYKKIHNNEEPILCAIHAGVECGMIFEKLPHLDMISLGPDVKDVHTVNEVLYLNSCKKLLKTIIEIINSLD